MRLLYLVFQRAGLFLYRCDVDETFGRTVYLRTTSFSDLGNFESALIRESAEDAIT